MELRVTNIKSEYNCLALCQPLNSDNILFYKEPEMQKKNENRECKLCCKMYKEWRARSGFINVMLKGIVYYVMSSMSDSRLVKIAFYHFMIITYCSMLCVLVLQLPNMIVIN